MPGTYPITGADKNYMTCGICVRMLTNAQTDYADDYLASAGTVTLTSVSGTTFSGTFANLTMDHVTIGSAADQYLSTVVGDCSSTITSGTFSTTLMMGSGSAAVAAITHVHWTNPGTLARRHR